MPPTHTSNASNAYLSTPPAPCCRRAARRAVATPTRLCRGAHAAGLGHVRRVALPADQQPPLQGRRQGALLRQDWQERLALGVPLHAVVPGVCAHR
eukprot:4976487-Prymnesium_polylepis.1